VNLLLLVLAGLAAHAQDLALSERLDALSRTRVSETAWFAEGTEFKDGLCHYQFDDGLFVPILAENNDQRVLGVVFLGEGRMRVQLQPGEAQALGNHLVLRAGWTAEEAQALLESPTMEVPVERGLLLSTDNRVANLLKDLDQAGASYFEVGADGADATYVVTPRAGKLQAQVVARNLWPERRNLLQETGLDAGAILGLERMLTERLGQPLDKTLGIADFQTPVRFGAVLGKKRPLGSKDADRWLTCVRDGSGLLELGARQVVFSHGLDDQTYHHLQVATLRESDPPQASLAPIGARVDLRAKFRIRGRFDVRTQSELTLRSEVDGTQHVLLRLPRDVVVSDRWELAPPTLVDGTALEWAVLEVDEARTSKSSISGASQVSMNPRRYVHHDLLVVLPKPLKAEEEISLRLDWTDRWMLDPQTGPTTGLKRFLPDLLPLGSGTRWSYALILDAPGTWGVDVVASGDTLEETQDEDTLVRGLEVGALGALNPKIVLGKWSAYQENAAKGLPSIQALLMRGQWPGALEVFPAEVRRVMTYYDRFLPPLEVGEIEVYQDRDRPTLGLEHSGHGVVEIHQLWRPDRSRIDKYDPDVGKAMLARSIARQYWMHEVSPAGMQDDWFATVLPEIFAGYYLRNINGPIEYRQRMKDVRELLEDPAEQVNFLVGGSAGDRFTLERGANHSLTGFSREDLVVPELERYYGLFVIGEMLRQRMGDEPFFSAMDEVFRVHRGGTATTEDFLQAWQARSETDLAPFFDFWIRGGLVPEIRLEHATRQGAGGLEWVGCLSADIPFGTFDVPVRVEEEDRAHDHWVKITDGQGQLVLPVEATDVSASVDPDGQILAYKRKSKAVNDLSCSGD